MILDDLERILPEKLRVTGRKLQFTVVAVIVGLLLICIILGSLVGLHAGGVMGPAGTGQGDSGGQFAGLISGDKGTGSKIQDCRTVDCLQTAAKIMENMDLDTKPCDDFYRYACGGWERRHTIPPDYVDVSVFSNLQDRTQERMREIIEQPVMRKTPQSAERKLKEFFGSCLHDYGRMREGGAAVLDLVRERLGGWYALDPDAWNNGHWDMQNAMATAMGDYDVSVLVDVYIGQNWRTKQHTITVRQGGLGLHYAFYQHPDKEDTQEAYKDYMRQTADLLLRDANLTLDASTREARIEQFVSDAYGQEAKVAELLSAARREPSFWRSRYVTIQEMEQNFTQIQWRSVFRKLFDGFEPDDTTSIRLTPLSYFNMVEELLQNETNNNDNDNNRIMNNYIVWTVARTFLRQLSWDYKHARAVYREKAYGVRASRPSWVECLSNARRLMGGAVAAQFIQTHIGVDSTSQVKLVFQHMKLSLEEQVEELNWMDNITRPRAKVKVQSVNATIAFPDDYFDNDYVDNLFARLDVNETYGYFRNYLNVTKFQRVLRAARLRPDYSHDDWLYATGSGSFSTYPYYSWAYNAFLVPPGALQHPLFSSTGPQFLNYGALGGLMAEELVNSVNERGRYMWANGTWADWWTVNTFAEYIKKKSCFAEYYNGLTVGPFLVDGINQTVTVNGRSQSSRTIVDIAGLRTGLKAYRKWVGTSAGDVMPVGIKLTAEQAYFVSAAQTRCYLRAPKYAYLFAKHSYIPENLMLNGALNHMPEFAEVFSCSAPSSMVTNDTCRVF